MKRLFQQMNQQVQSSVESLSSLIQYPTTHSSSFAQELGLRTRRLASLAGLLDGNQVNIDAFTPRSLSVSSFKFPERSRATSAVSVASNALESLISPESRVNSTAIFGPVEFGVVEQVDKIQEIPVTQDKLNILRVKSTKTSLGAHASKTIQNSTKIEEFVPLKVLVSAEIPKKETKIDHEDHGSKVDELLQQTQQLQKSNFYLSTKVNAQQIEMKSLINHNDNLRNENKKMVEEEIRLLETIEKLKQSSVSPDLHIGHQTAPSPDLALRERVMHSVEMKIDYLGGRFGEVKNSKLLKTYMGHMRNLKTLLINDTNLFDACENLIEALFTTCLDSLDLNEESDGKDETIYRIHQENDQKRIEAESSLVLLEQTSAKAIKSLQSENLGLAKKLEETFVHLENHLNRNNSFEDECKALKVTNESLKHSLEQPGIPTVITVPEYIGNEDLQVDLDNHQLKIGQLHKHIGKLDGIIISCNAENSQLRNDMQDQEREFLDVENQVSKLRILNGELRGKLEIETSLSQKAALLIQSLQQEVDKVRTNLNHPENETQRLERAINEEIHAIKSSLTNSASEPHDLQKFMTQLQGINGNTDQLAHLNGLVTGNISITTDYTTEITTLQSSNQVLHSRIEKLKLKMKARESVWLVEIDELRSVLESFKVEHKELQHLVDGYADQYQYVKFLVKGEQKSHPFAFAETITQLTSKLTDGSHSAGLLQLKLDVVTSEMNEKTQLLADQTLVSSKSSQECLQLQQDLSKAEHSVHELEENLAKTSEGKSNAEKKLKKIVFAFQQMYAV